MCRQPLRAKDPVLPSAVPEETCAVGGVLAEETPPSSENVVGSVVFLEPGMAKMLEGHGCQQGPWLQHGGHDPELTTSLSLLCTKWVG